MSSEPYTPTASSPDFRAALIGYYAREGIAAEIGRIEASLSGCCEVVNIDLGKKTDLAETPFDLAVVVGGDGSILRTVDFMGENQRPILGVNAGKLGFLADVRPEEAPEIVGWVLAGKCRLVRHLMFEAALLQNERVLASRVGLNELALRAGPPYQILHVGLHVDDEWVATFSCDGVILSTPVGSTAHSLSAGGPILRKDLQAFVITPLSPHTLTHRPVVDSADRVYEFSLAPGSAAAALVVDGREIGSLEEGRRVRVQRAKPEFLLVETPNRSYYRTLREKLLWSGGLTGDKPPPHS